MTVGGLVVLGILVILGLFVLDISQGVGVWGPENHWEVTVTNTYVDHSKDESHYMVATDTGVFEVQNSLAMAVSNADELFGQIQKGKRYRLTTRGNKVVNYARQEYPYITAVESLPDPPTTQPAKIANAGI